MTIRHPSAPRVTVTELRWPLLMLVALDVDEPPVCDEEEEDAETCEDADRSDDDALAEEAPWPSSLTNDVSTRPSSKIWVRRQLSPDGCAAADAAAIMIMKCMTTPLLGTATVPKSIRD